ncbi:MAG: SDR family oxidoreductase [Phycisphaerae bacterium]
MAGRFEGKRALVTGGASGIGRAVALSLAKEGCAVAIGDLNSDAGAETVELIEKAGGKGCFEQMDVSQADQVAAAIAGVTATMGGLDLAFNNAGILGSMAGRVSESSEDNWDSVLAVNLKGTWLCLKEEIAVMRRGGGGAIVNSSSAAAMGGSFVSAPYIASKHGVIGLTKAAAVECAKESIRVNAVCPGYIRTPMFDRYVQLGPRLYQLLSQKAPMGRLGKPEEVAAAVLWLLSEESAFVTGHALGIDGGLGAI